MKSLSQRAQPRVKYPVDVRLLAPPAPPTGPLTADTPPAGSPREVHARSHNLSASGIFVEARQLVEVGTRVMCDIPLPGGTRRLAGEVARLQPLPFSSSAVGLGIRFVELDASARTLLEALVQREQEPAHLVHARFEGMAEAVRSQAVLTKDGVRLSAALPFLKPGSTVEISFVSGKSRVLSRGVVREAVVDNRGPDGVPRLSVDVRLLNRTGGLGRPDDGADMIEEPDEDDVTAVETPRARAAQQAARPSAPRPAVEPVHPHDRPGGPAAAAHARPAPAPGPGGACRRRPRWCRGRRTRPGWCGRSRSAWGSPAALALFILGVAVARQRLDPAPRPPVATERAVRGPTIEPAQGHRAGRSPPRPRPAIDEAPPPAELPRTLYLPWRQGEARAGTVPAAPPSRSAPPNRSAPGPRLPPNGRGGPRRPRPRPTARPVDLPELLAPTYTTEDALRTAVPVPSDAPGPTMEHDGEELVAVVPFEGSTEGMTHYPLAQPHGIAVNLPNAHSVLALGRHTVMNEGVRWVWIRRYEKGGIQVRFTLAYRTPEVLRRRGVRRHHPPAPGAPPRRKSPAAPNATGRPGGPGPRLTATQSGAASP